MPLIFQGEMIETLTCISIKAIDASTGETVIVKASHEAFQDYQLCGVQEVASDKYDRGQSEADGSIIVRTADFA
jgi:hypothetical protein